MVTEELVNLIAESIYRHIYDLPHPSDLEHVVSKKKDYIDLTDIEKSFFLTVAHDVMCVFDDYYDAEYDEDDDDAYDNDDDYDTEDRAISDDEGYGAHGEDEDW